MGIELAGAYAGNAGSFSDDNPYGVRTTNTAGGVKGALAPGGQKRAQHNEFNKVFSKPMGTPGLGTPGVPGSGNDYKGKTVPGGAQNLPSNNTAGSQSGPGILENWFNQRAAGSDPAYEYSMGRGMDEIDRRMAAGGSFNSGARGQQLGDYGANMGARRMEQLDALAGGASGEHLGRLGLMFNQGLGLAGGESGLVSAYDLGAAGNMQAATDAQRMLNLNRLGVDSQGTNQAFKNVSSMWTMGGGK